MYVLYTDNYPDSCTFPQCISILCGYSIRQDIEAAPRIVRCSWPGTTGTNRGRKAWHKSALTGQRRPPHDPSSFPKRPSSRYTSVGTQYEYNGACKTILGYFISLPSPFHSVPSPLLLCRIPHAQNAPVLTGTVLAQFHLHSKLRTSTIPSGRARPTPQQSIESPPSYDSHDIVLVLVLAAGTGTSPPYAHPSRCTKTSRPCHAPRDTQELLLTP